MSFIWHNNGNIIFDVFLYQNINMLVGVVITGAVAAVADVVVVITVDELVLHTIVVVLVQQ